jgi:hypothetical protein
MSSISVAHKCETDNCYKVLIQINVLIESFELHDKFYHTL